MNAIIKAREPVGDLLFIDDDPDELYLLRIAIEELGYKNKVVECPSAIEGLAFLKETTREVCFILADIKMPRMDGLQLKKAIEDTPELKMKSIPFIYHTNGMNEDEVMIAYSL